MNDNEIPMHMLKELPPEREDDEPEDVCVTPESKTPCEMCGNWLTHEEVAEFGDCCEDCVMELTSGIYLDDPYEELD